MDSVPWKPLSPPAIVALVNGIVVLSVAVLVLVRYHRYRSQASAIVWQLESPGSITDCPPDTDVTWVPQRRVIPHNKGSSCTPSSPQRVATWNEGPRCPCDDLESCRFLVRSGSVEVELPPAGTRAPLPDDQSAPNGVRAPEATESAGVGADAASMRRSGSTELSETIPKP